MNVFVFTHLRGLHVKIYVKISSSITSIPYFSLNLMLTSLPRIADQHTLGFLPNNWSCRPVPLCPVCLVLFVNGMKSRVTFKMAFCVCLWVALLIKFIEMGRITMSVPYLWAGTVDYIKQTNKNQNYMGNSICSLLL